MRKKYKSANFNDRKGVEAPDMLLLHYTGMETGAAALARLCDPAAEVSAHYVIEEEGRVHALVPEDKRAWHAGASYWAGESDINSRAIGIEIVNPGHEFGYTAFRQKQLSQVIVLCKKIIKKWSIPAARVLGHSDVAPGRKFDPGHLFPWAALAQAGIGLWPLPVEMDYQAAEDLIANQGAVHELLAGYGYNPDLPYKMLMNAFMRHFHLEKFTHWDDEPEPDILTIARLLALVRARHEV